jgi:hypothetical protein
MQAAIQGPILEALGENFYSFVYGLDSKQLTQRMLEHCQSDWVSISIDGSAFDSTQHAEIFNMIDIPFMRHMAPYLTKHFDLLGPDSEAHVQ